MAAAVQQTELVFEFASNGMDDAHQLEDPLSFPAVIVEQVPNTDLFYSSLDCDEVSTRMMDDASLDVVEEQIIEDNIGLSVEASCQDEDETMETIEAAEALLNMESPNAILDEKRMFHGFAHSLDGEITATMPHISVMSDKRPEVINRSSAHVAGDEDDSADESPRKNALKQRKKKGRKMKPARPSSPVTAPHLPIKKKNKDGKGNTIYLWEFLLALLQDKNTCPKYIKWTQREKGIFKLVDSKAVSKLWGKHKNKPDMNYETMGRALRYYYQRGILAKVEGQRLVYQFKEMPKDLVVIDDDSVEHSTSNSETSPSCTATSPTKTRSTTYGVSQLQNTNKMTVVPQSVLMQHIKQEHTSLLTQQSQKAAVQQGPFLQTIQGLQSNQILQQGSPEVSKSTVTIASSGHPMSRTISVPAQVPMVMTSGAHAVGTLMLQTIPLTTVLSGTDTMNNSQSKVILRAIPCSEASKETITIQAALSPTDLDGSGLSEIQQAQVIATSLSLTDGGFHPVINNCVQPSPDTISQLVTINSNSQPMVAHRPGSVIATVLKPPEPIVDTPEFQASRTSADTTSPSVKMAELEKELGPTSDDEPNYQHLQTVVLSNTNGVTTSVIKVEGMDKDFESVMEGSQNLNCSLSHSPNCALTPVVKLEANEDCSMLNLPSDHRHDQDKTLVDTNLHDTLPFLKLENAQMFSHAASMLNYPSNVAPSPSAISTSVVVKTEPKKL
ncbi:ETS-related transcription factor Elf-1 isoform X1 [Hemiscyllium ocellatum]|uniref:ETS-related transcription factor Elf-1 isoform X1 n=1 Tax=Hemiscyllium ocellatum TaxID=170820 RepID=UPI002966E138|nr:ETS-related transcription factor Elf-1 isoform X1 [Hemiscyllium ocellatum]XP_060688601.1 ETS-related transcription factor Elf-1 isoform X1 [Hemiscyllium ocellatum]XP_060688602.1 ETS-related transcription factor Elf-1 isoform X1 [Hemiscyllium ocellatum]XP_060688603.1 ETS-related transcription factor Elf-1 isoform X1 [Hemiscyllium ocellatum]XP_060688604.1 ETS-related transcription factor Elf-1 isoform X1 [Hemiscyllium ocellatum]XP_060688606.1 ETS-related transcription factor Elf-1 isoform X1 